MCILLYIFHWNGIPCFNQHWCLWDTTVNKLRRNISNYSRKQSLKTNRWSSQIFMVCFQASSKLASYLNRMVLQMRWCRSRSLPGQRPEARSKGLHISGFYRQWWHHCMNDILPNQAMVQIQYTIDQSKFNFENIHTCKDNNSSLCFNPWKICKLAHD